MKFELIIIRQFGGVQDGIDIPSPEGQRRRYRCGKMLTDSVRIRMFHWPLIMMFVTWCTILGTGTILLFQYLYSIHGSSIVLL
jgi:hypothetical protein